MAGWGDWFRSNRNRRGREATAVAAADVWERAGQRSAPVLPAIAEIEATALEVYAAYGLPVRHGHYQRAPEASEWVWLAEELPADLRFAMVLERPLEDGWRYATLEDLGRYPGAPNELAAAAGLLGGCRHLKDRLLGREPGDPGGDIQSAIRMGANWQALREALAWREESRLKLTVPSDVLPEPAPPAEPEPELDLGPVPAPPPKRKARAPRKARKPKTDGSGGL